METTYREREGGRRSTGRRRGSAKASLGPKERRRLGQLVVCLVLFAVVFVGKGVFPEKMAQARERILETIQADTAFRAVFASLGASISDGEPVMDTLGELWVEVFGGETVAVAAPLGGEVSLVARSQAALLSGYPSRVQPAAFWLGEARPEEQMAGQQMQPQAVPALQAEPAVEHVDYDGPALPDNATMDKYNLETLGVAETATPVLGWVSSTYGWREHPVDGGEKFHNGVDLAVNTGTQVLAFAAGTVEYIGDSPIYGLYLQIDHGSGLKSFYAHCSQLCVQQGQQVQAGEMVAQSGATGNATGPHLHFELKLNDTLLNPLYYIQTA